MIVGIGPCVFWMIGLSGSGKSTIAKEYAKQYNATILSSDKIREELYGDENIQGDNNEVFSLLHTRAYNYLRNGISVVYDATNLTRKNRAHFFKFLRDKCVPVKHYAVVMCKSYNLCVQDNLNREKVVPDHVIRKQVCNFNIPFFEEGFDYITFEGWGNAFKEINKNQKYDLYVTSNEERFNSIISLMSGFEQKNKHHELDLLEHCNKTAQIISEKTGDNVLTLAAQIHDVGKLYTQTFDESNEAHYYNHAEIGTYKLLQNLDAFNLSPYEIIKCLFYINYHMLCFNFNSPKICSKWREIFGDDNFDALMELHLADKMACKK